MLYKLRQLNNSKTVEAYQDHEAFLLHCVHMVWCWECSVMLLLTRLVGGHKPFVPARGKISGKMTSIPVVAAALSKSKKQTYKLATGFNLAYYGSCKSSEVAHNPGDQF